jgi:hypothetical protein
MNAIGHREHRAAIAHVAREHDELVAAEARDGVGLADKNQNTT